MKIPFIQLLASLALLPYIALAEDKPRAFIDEHDPSYRPDVTDPEDWKEGKVEIPPYPKNTDLVEFQVDKPSSSFHYYIDSKSLSIGEDGVIRYSLVIESKTGAKNISFEGMRCDEHEYNVYAYGSQGKFREVRNPKWISFEHDRYNLHRRDLYELYVCDLSQQSSYSPKEILYRIKRSASINASDFY